MKRFPRIVDNLKDASYGKCCQDSQQLPLFDSQSQLLFAHQFHFSSFPNVFLRSYSLDFCEKQFVIILHRISQTLKFSISSLSCHCNCLLAFSAWGTMASLLVFLGHASLTFTVGSSFCLRLFLLCIFLGKTFLYLSKFWFLCHLYKLKL